MYFYDPHHRFPPVSTPDIRVLILGSMPGVRSLALNQYYGHPRNLFWPLMAELVGVPVAAPYAERLVLLNAAGIGLWDSLQAAERPGSLDASIVTHTEVANDFPTFLADHRRVRAIAFNGKKSESTFTKHVLKAGHADLFTNIALLPMPSTSPANASIPLVEKRRRWEELLVYL
ncbi:MAG: DNA-deoxyinosine glycosylase [Caldilineaceae bacterium]